MNDEQRRMAVFRAQSFGTHHFHTLRRLISLMGIQRIALDSPCRALKMIVSLQIKFTGKGPNMSMITYREALNQAMCEEM
ncbi:MAG: hypothetical protein Q9M30_03915, partial [Mariprofundaceae bacterium]|nr:hypothetical protein [Mariprofundaceae bacterium]